MKHLLTAMLAAMCVAALGAFPVSGGEDAQSGSMIKVGGGFDRWAFECRPRDKKISLSKIDANTYRSYLLKVQGDVIQMIHDDPDPEVAYQGIFLTKHPGLLKSGIMVAEWNAAVLKEASPENMPVFQAVLSPGNRDGEVWFPVAVKLSTEGIATNLGTIKKPLPINEFHDFRAAVDPDLGEFVLWMDGAVVQQGVLPKVQTPQKPMVAFGDCSGGIAGRTALHFFRIGVAQKPPETVLALGRAPMVWNFECAARNGEIIMRKIDANSYRKDLLKADGDQISMIHDDPAPDAMYQGIFISGHPKLRVPGILVAEWEVAVRKPAERGDIPVFNVNLAPLDSKGVCRFQTNVFFAPARVATKIGENNLNFPLNEFHRFRVALNPENGDCALWMDGEILQQG